MRAGNGTERSAAQRSSRQGRLRCRAVVEDVAPGLARAMRAGGGMQWRAEDGVER